MTIVVYPIAKPAHNVLVDTSNTDVWVQALNDHQAEIITLQTPVLGKVSTDEPQSEISTETDLTGMSIGFTLTESSFVSLRAFGLIQATNAGARWVMRIKDSTTLDTVAQDFGTCSVANVISSSAHPETRVFALDAGTYLYKLTLGLAGGSGTVALEADENGSAWLNAEYKGPVA